MKNQSKFLAVSSFAGAGLLFAPAVFAHTFGAHGAGFADGLAHPFLGLDHLLAMLAVGLWAAQLGGAALWRVPAVFLAAMAGGALLADPSVDAASLETAVGGSVLALGLLVALALRLPGGLGLLAVALCASLHGYAHGLEMPQAASPLAYGLGFLSATAGLHLLGVSLGMSLGRFRLASRVGGVAIAAAGLLILAV
jgi:urease accessory protein